MHRWIHIYRLAIAWHHDVVMTPETAILYKLISVHAVSQIACVPLAVRRRPRGETLAYPYNDTTTVLWCRPQHNEIVSTCRVVTQPSAVAHLILSGPSNTCEVVKSINSRSSWRSHPVLIYLHHSVLSWRRYRHSWEDSGDKHSTDDNKPVLVKNNSSVEDVNAGRSP